MRHLLFAVVTLAAPLSSQSSRTPLASGSYAVTNVNVIPMTRDTVIRGATVLVKDGRVAEVGPAARIRIPAGTRQVDGQGGYLIPGLADMHTHLYSDTHVPDTVGRAEMGIFLANGITSVRLLIGTPYQLTLRKDLMAGTVVGPQLWLASPQFAGRPDTNARIVTTPEGARAAVREEAARGWDFLKITNWLSAPVYDAIIDEAKKTNMRVDGHVNAPAVTVKHVAESGQHMQHLDGWFEALMPDSLSNRLVLTQYGVFPARNWVMIDAVDESKIAPLAGIVARSGVFSTPTNAFFTKVFADGETEEEIRARPDWALIPPAFKDYIFRARRSYWADAALVFKTPERRAKYTAVRDRIVKALSDSGAKLLAGSDAPDWFMSEGYTLHRELAAFVRAGLTPYQALATATRNPAEFLNASKEWGTIEAGKRADFVLLTANPLADIRNTTQIAATAIGGRWITKPELDRMILRAATQLNQ